jgi:hypothetical protein
LNVSTETLASGRPSRTRASDLVVRDTAASAYTGTMASSVPKKMSWLLALMSFGVSASVALDSYTGVISRKAPTAAATVMAATTATVTFRRQRT